MKRTIRLEFTGLISSLLLAFAMCAVAAITAAAQSDLGRQTVAVTYPLDQTVNVRFRGTTRLPRLKGEAKVKRTGRRNTRVELNIDNVPRAAELGEPYTTYVLWAISPEGRVDNLGEIKRSGSFLFDTKIDVTTPLQTFALIVTAEPHFLVRAPSRMIVLENLPPTNPGEASVATVDVRYIGNTSDYFESARVPEVADRDYTKTPVSLLGARQSINLARFAGAERDAAEELKQATTELESAENAWRLKQAEAEVDALARNATSLGARAEEVALSRKSARERRAEISRRDADIREAERTAATASEEITKLQTELERERRERELIERDLANANEQLREQRSEVARLREELQSTRSSAEEARITLARIEGERQAEETRRANEQNQQSQLTAAANFRLTLNQIGAVRDTPRGITLVLPDTMFTGVRSPQLSASAAPALSTLATLLAANPNIGVIVEAYSDNKGVLDVLQQLTDARAIAVQTQLVRAGVESSRIQASGLGANNPVAANTSLATRARNRRVEIIFVARPANTNNANNATNGNN